MRLNSRIRGLVLEVVIAATLVVALVVWGFSVPIGTPFPARWIGLIASTSITFGYALRWCRPYWHRARFWFAFTALLVLHTGIFVAVLLNVEEWRLVWFPFAELPAFFAICLLLNAVSG